QQGLYATPSAGGHHDQVATPRFGRPDDGLVGMAAGLGNGVAADAQLLAQTPERREEGLCSRLRILVVLRLGVGEVLLPTPEELVRGDDVEPGDLRADALRESHAPLDRSLGQGRTVGR